jgi:hypothetical protein
MSLSKIDIIRQQGGLARPPLSQDGVSALVFFGSTIDKSTKYFTTEDALADFTETDIEFYHIKQYFDYTQSPLYVSASTSGASDFSEIVDLKNFSNGEVRQYGVIDLITEYVSSQITALQAIGDQIENEYAPGQILYTAALPSGDTVEDLTTLEGLDSPRVSMIVSEDTTDEVLALRATYGFVSTIGATLGTVSSASVHENIGWVSKFNITTSNYTDPGFIDGSLLTSKSLTFLNTLDDYKYIFIRSFVGNEGSYWNYSYTAASSTSDFGTIENNRVYDKSFRNLNILYLPELNSPIYVNSDGQLAGGTVKYLETVGQRALQPLQDAGELSAFSVEIDPKQNVLSTSTLQVIAKIVPVGVAKVIEIKLGYTLSL